jgi:hypothetical protein
MSGGILSEMAMFRHSIPHSKSDPNGLCRINPIEDLGNVAQTARLMNENTMFLQNVHDFEKNMHAFIRIEVETSLTFAEIALSRPEHRKEDTAKAREGYETALRFIAEARVRFPNHPVSSSSLEGLQRIQQMLEQLGEQF